MWDKLLTYISENSVAHYNKFLNMTSILEYLENYQKKFV